MKNIIAAVVLVLFGALPSYYSVSQEKAIPGQRWKVAYKNSSQGEPLAGSKKELINAIRSGNPDGVAGAYGRKVIRVWSIFVSLFGILCSMIKR